MASNQTIRSGLLLTSLSVLLLLGAACDSPDAIPNDANISEDSLSLEIWGESYCETGLPASLFEDGYSVVFDKFLVSLSSATVDGENIAPAIEISDATVWDLVKPGPHVITRVNAAPGTYDQSAFTTAAATNTSTSGPPSIMSWRSASSTLREARLSTLQQRASAGDSQPTNSTSASLSEYMRLAARRRYS